MKIIELKMKRPRFFVSAGDDDEEKNVCPLEKLFLRMTSSLVKKIIKNKRQL